MSAKIASSPADAPVPSRRSKPISVIAGLLALSAVVIAAFLFRSRSAAAGPASQAVPPAPKVTVAPVELQSLSDYDEITGHVDAIETVDLRARVSGHLEAVHFQAGQIVQAGDVLFTIDPRWYRATFDLATAQALDAEREARRANELLAASAISSEEAEGRRARAAEAEAELATARLDLEHTQVRSPITGRIGRALIIEGNLVSGSPGDATLLATIVSVGRSYVYADLDEATYLRFARYARERGAAAGGRIPVGLELADEAGYPRQGYVESASNRMNPETGSLTLRCVFPDSDGTLVPGLFARLRVPICAPRPTLLVNDRAVQTDQSQKFVLVVGPDRVASYRTVTLGSTVGHQLVIESGLQSGENVIVNGLQRVRPGMTVSPEPDVAAVPPNSAASLAKN